MKSVLYHLAKEGAKESASFIFQIFRLLKKNLQQLVLWLCFKFRVCFGETLMIFNYLEQNKYGKAEGKYFYSWMKKKKGFPNQICF